MANDGVKYVDVCTKAAIELNIRAYIGYSSTKLLQIVRYSNIPLHSSDMTVSFSLTQCLSYFYCYYTILIIRDSDQTNVPDYQYGTASTVYGTDQS